MMETTPLLVKKNDDKKIFYRSAKYILLSCVFVLLATFAVTTTTSSSPSSERMMVRIKGTLLALLRLCSCEEDRRQRRVWTRQSWAKNRRLRVLSRSLRRVRRWTSCRLIRETGRTSARNSFQRQCRQTSRSKTGLK